MPVGVEVAIDDESPEPEDRLGTVEAPAGAGAVHAVLDEVTAGALDDPGGDRPAPFQRGGVVQVGRLVGKVVGAAVGRCPGWRRLASSKTRLTTEAASSTTLATSHLLRAVGPGATSRPWSRRASTSTGVRGAGAAS